MVVFKFGGKSLSTFEKIQKLAQYVKQRFCDDKIIVVVSAMGSTTNELLDMSKHFSSIDGSREIDALVATGEQQSAALFSMALQQEGVQAESFAGFQLPIITEGKAGKSYIKSISKLALQKCVDEGKIPVVAGFQGINEKGEITTLGRGGSDTTAVALGALFECKVEIYSDFDGIYATDPRKYACKKLEKISYDSILRLAQSGAKVLSANAALLAKQKRVCVECKGSPSPENPGTILTLLPKPISALNVKDGLCQIDLVFDFFALDMPKILFELAQKPSFERAEVTKHSLSLLVSQENAEEVTQYLLKQIQ